MKTSSDHLSTEAAFIGIREVCRISGLSKATIIRRIKRGDFPSAAWRENKIVRYDLGEILAWREAQLKRREPTAQPQGVSA